MNKLIRKTNSFAKDLLLASRIPLVLYPIRSLFKFLYSFTMLTAWVNKNSRTTKFSDFYKPVRNYKSRINLFKYLAEKEALDTSAINYLEFGVASGVSFLWWLELNKNPESTFAGFDTFEGLPEDWHFFKKGAFSHDLPTVPDQRATFVKGLFQDTLYNFLKNYSRKNGIKLVLHMDADLYSSTLFALTMIAPYMQPGDIIFFDEFNIPNHEFAAWHDFTRSYYIKYEVVGAVNNFYQTCFKIL